MAGLSQPEALTVALAAQYVDDNPNTWPVDPHDMPSNVLNPAAIQRLSYHHFTEDGYDPMRTVGEMAYHIVSGGADLDSYIDRRVVNPINPQLDRLLAAANFNLRTASNPNGERPCTRLQLFGEYLHAFEDTFGHRDSSNAPISVNLGVGHGPYGNEPDRTFNDGAWQVRAGRTLEAEREVFQKIKASFGMEARDAQGFPIRFEDLETTLREFNKIHEDEGVEGGSFRSKKSMLNKALRTVGFGSIADYNVFNACERRQENLRDALRTMSDFTGLILQTPRQCPTVRGQRTE